MQKICHFGFLVQHLSFGHRAHRQVNFHELLLQSVSNDVAINTHSLTVMPKSAATIFVSKTLTECHQINANSLELNEVRRAGHCFEHQC